MIAIALILSMWINEAAAAGYQGAMAALKHVGERDAAELDSLLASPGPALAGNRRVTALLEDNREALALFKQAAQTVNDGNLFAPKREKLDPNSPPPNYEAHLKLFKLVLIDAKVNAVRGQRDAVENDLLATAGFMAQLSEQKSGILISELVRQLCLQKSYTILSDSIRGSSASPEYLDELAARLSRAASKQDFMWAAMLEETEMAKDRVRETMSPVTAEAERNKMPFLKRLLAERLQNQEYFAIIYERFEEGADERGQVFVKAFRANDPAIADDFVSKQLGAMQARREAVERRGLWGALKDAVQRGTEAKGRLADVALDSLTRGSIPMYSKLIARYHVASSQLGVLRTALAVKLYQRGRRRLPDRLSQLVPAFLPAVPQDPFNRFAPLSYVAAGRSYAIYSFGPDGMDGKGSAAVDCEAYASTPARNTGDILFVE
ncbi:MAG TPA: hypothetical protein DCM05_10280 [Elusimicrobia bacterium]|nr:hypothetical protein [Elusimicrobiota bacterium]